MAIRLTLKRQPPCGVSLAALTPAFHQVAKERLTETASVERIGAVAVSGWASHGRVIDWFDVAIGAAVDATDSPDVLTLHGDLRRFHDVAAGLASGEWQVAGSLGDGAGRAMSGGRLRIAGDVGREAVVAMSGGTLQVAGNAGDRLAANQPGSRNGMTGGEVWVGGAAGDEVGARMRRGLIVVGSCGDFAAANMRAGTLLVRGRCGRLPGAGMIRGTVMLADGPPEELSLSFVPGGAVHPSFCGLLRNHLRTLSGDDYQLPDIEWQQYHGDLLRECRGEIFVNAA